MVQMSTTGMSTVHSEVIGILGSRVADSDSM